MSRATFELQQYNPGKRLVLTARKNAATYPRILFTFLFLILTLLPVVYSSLPTAVLSTQIFPSIFEQTGTADTIFYPLFIGFALLIWYVLLFIFVKKTGLSLGNWNRVEINQENNLLQATFHGHYLLWTKNHERPLDEISTINVELTQNPSNRTHFQFFFLSEETNNRFPPLRIRGDLAQHDHPQHILPVCFAIAQIADLPNYTFTRKNPQNIQLSLSNPEHLPEGNPVPPIDEELKLPEEPELEIFNESDSQDFPPSDTPLPPFDPATYQNRIPSSTGESFYWKPGEYVRIISPSISHGKRLVISAFMGVIIGLSLTAFIGKLVHYAAKQIWPSVPFWSVGLGLVLISMVSIWSFLGYKYRKRDTIFDWFNEKLHIWTGVRNLVLPLEQVQKIIVTENQHLDQQKEQTIYQAQLSLVLPEKEVTILWTGTTADRSELYSLIASLAGELAKELQVQWEWQETTDS